MPTSDATRLISSAFLDARRSAKALASFPGELPGTLEAAYAIQTESISRWPDDVAGWKVGGIPPKFRETFGTDRLAGPIFRRSIKRQNGEAVAMPVFRGGFAAVEGEIILRIGKTVAPGTVDPDSDDAAALVGEAFIGVELASSPLKVINDLGPVSIISDFGNNAGLIVGPSLANWQALDLDALLVTTRIDGALVGHAPASAIPGGPMAAFRFLLGNCTERGITLPEGTLVSTGAITGVHQAEPGASAEVAFGDHGTIRLELEEAQAQVA